MTADLYTAQLTKDTVTYVTNQYFDSEQPFAFPRYGNQCVHHTTGRDYLAAVAQAIRNAKSFIMITDWQLDYDVELDQRGVTGHPGRLSELLAGAIQRGVHVRVMLYDSISYVLDTHDDTAQDILLSLPKGKGSIEVLLENPNTGRGTLSRKSGVLFSHHQKSVVIDGQIAFVGGLDLAYGRWDTNAFDVVINPKLHILNDAYNQQLNPMREMTAAEKKLTEPSQGKPGFRAAIGNVFDELQQPRQPWQDVALQINGPAVFDVFVNFILRWNSFAGSDTNFFDSRMQSQWFSLAKGANFLVDPLKEGDGSSIVQICRSASSKQLNHELALWDDNHRYVNDDWKQPNPKRKKIVQAAREAWAANQQTSILDAMVNCIRSAQGFIYIENQFFMSACGNDKHGQACPSNNPIIAELANVIGQAIYAERPFHVWIVLPEHPEGKLEEAGTQSQAWWALQGVRQANSSLINCINATLVAKHSKEWNLTKLPATNQQITDILKSHGLQDKWHDYLTVLNLRNYGSTERVMLTEMIYIHSKLLIVDDAVAIIGSANINDRSLNGNGDTELAAVVVDKEEAVVTDVGQGIHIITRKFARSLRMNQWKKHLGMLVDQTTTGVQKEAGSPSGINIEQPLDSASIKGIQQLAATNRRAYNKVFTHTPRNEFSTLLEGRKQYPFKMAKIKKYEVNGTPIGNINPDGTLREGYVLVDEPTKVHDYTIPPPLQTAFMKNKEHNIEAATKELRAIVKGFWVEMPLDWGSGENKTPKPPGGLPAAIAENNLSDNPTEASV